MVLHRLTHSRSNSSMNWSVSGSLCSLSTWFFSSLVLENRQVQILQGISFFVYQVLTKKFILQHASYLGLSFHVKEIDLSWFSVVVAVKVLIAFLFRGVKLCLICKRAQRSTKMRRWINKTVNLLHRLSSPLLPNALPLRRSKYSSSSFCEIASSSSMMLGGNKFNPPPQFLF